MATTAKQISAVTLIPLGLIGGMFAFSLAFVRGLDGSDSANAKEIATLKVQVASIEKRVDEQSARIEKGDERWNRIVEDLGKIKERLGIVEAKTPGQKQP